MLITDGEQRAALATVRSLGRAGYRVCVCSTRRRSLAGASRYATRTTAVADPLEEPERFAADILEIVRKWKIDLVLPIAEGSLLAILGCEDIVREAVVPFPGLRAFERICDKALVTSVAAGIGIKVPAQCVVTEPSARAQLESRPLQFPVVMKPARSVIGTDSRRVTTSVSYARDRAALNIALDALPREAYPLLIQERVVGPGVGVFLLRWDGQILASFFHRRIREKPPSGGVSVYRESVPPDPELLKLSAELLCKLDWAGVAMVEYKVDAATGTPYLMEINGRLWGSLQLAIDAGVDFPALLVAAGLGRMTAPVRSYRTGIRSRWFWGDVDHLLARMRRGSDDPALPPDAPGRGRVIRDFLTLFRRNDRGEVLRLEDPAPAIRETIDWFRRR